MANLGRKTGSESQELKCAERGVYSEQAKASQLEGREKYGLRRGQGHGHKVGAKPKALGKGQRC